MNSRCIRYTGCPKNLIISPIHTADADEIQLSSLVASAVWTHTRQLLRLMTSDDIMTSLLKKLSLSIKIHVVKPLWSLFGQFPNCRPNPLAVVMS